MATALTGTNSNVTYLDLLQMGSGVGNGITGTLTNICDGGGTTAPLQLSQTAVNITSAQINGKALVLGGPLTTVGSDAAIFRFTGATDVTFPTSGTILTSGSLAGGLLPSLGGTGVSNNDASTLTFSGNYATTFTRTGVTNVTFPTTGTLSTLAGSETLTNKTLTTPVIATISNTGTVTLPTATTTLVGTDTTDTLTNKTITSPKINAILDTNGNSAVTLTATGSAVNAITITNAAASGGPSIASTGSDTNIALTLSSKGSGSVVAKTLGGTVPLVLSNNTNTVSLSTPTLTGNRTITVPDADITLFTAATQAQQETGTATTAAVTPAVQHYHPSATKAWCKFNGSGTPTISASYNCSSITDLGTGNYLVNYTNNFSSANYSSLAGCLPSGGTAAIAQVSSQSVSATQIQIITAAGAAFDATLITFAAFGDQ